MPITFSDAGLRSFISDCEWGELQPSIDAAHALIENRNGAGNDFLGFIRLPENYDKAEFAAIKKAAAKIREDSDVLVVIGIGGSYLGARSAIEFLHTSNYNLLPNGPQIFFAGNSISAQALSEVLALCENKRVSVNVISKSGTTTEPAIAFRVLRGYMEKRYGKDGARKRIYVTTDKARGALKTLADAEGYQTFVVPDDIGGRYSVLTAVGLLPIAVSGTDIDAVMAGAADGMKMFAVNDLDKNAAYRYAAARNILLRKGKNIEILATYEPSLQQIGEWWKQLYGESEGKCQRGIFPASVLFSADLHSMGQYIQDGQRFLMETVLDVKKAPGSLLIPADNSANDGLSFLEGKDLDYVNRCAQAGTRMAHNDGGVPVMTLTLEDTSAYEYGSMVYFFERACALSGYLLGVNPFNQPGVESYKKNMYALLGKPGFEELRAVLESRLANN